MGHSTCRLGIAIALIAGINGHLVAQDPPVSLNDYVTAMQKEGWAVQKSENLAGNVTIELKKEEKGPEEHGLFGIQWDNRVSWKFTYFPDENILRMLSAEGVRMEKALLFGKWKPIERYDSVPADILQKTLQRATSDAMKGAS